MQQPSASPTDLSRQLPFGPKTIVISATALIAYGLTRRSKRCGTFVSANVQYGLPGGPLASGLAATPHQLRLAYKV